MNSKNIDVLRKILYAVETGGQVYGNSTSCLSFDCRIRPCSASSI